MTIENANNDKGSCISCNRPLESETEISNNICRECSNFEDKRSLFEFLIYGMAIGYYLKIEKYPLEVSLKSAFEYISEISYWKEQKSKIDLPKYENLLRNLNYKIYDYNYYDYMHSVKAGAFASDRYDLFISHSWQDPDDQLVDEIVQELKNSGYKIYYDRDVFNKEPGDVDEFAKKGIEKSRHCILFLCETYFTRKNTKFELEHIIEKKDNDDIFPIRGKNIDSPFLNEQGDLGKVLRDIKAINIGPDNNSPSKIAQQLITWKRKSEGMEVYPEAEKNSRELFAEEFQVMKELEGIIGEPIPPIDQNIEEITSTDKKNRPKLGFIEDEGKVIGLLLRKHKIQKLPDLIPILQSLQYIDINLGIATEAIAKLKSLIHLDLDNNQLTTLPDSFSQLENLKYLNLKYNQLTILPDSFGHLESLQELNLYYNKLNILPDSFCQLKSLQELNLQDNKLTTLPDSFGQLESLQELNLQNNKLTSLPDSFGQLESLQELNLQGNILRTLPDSFSQLENLQTLNLSYNELKTLPDSFGKLESVQEINLGYNMLRTLPESFGNLRSLKKLYLYFNKLKTLPWSIGDLKSLQRLDLNHNMLTTFPNSFSQLESLQILILQNNLLMTLPELFLELPNLISINVNANPLDKKSHEIFKKLQNKGI